MPNPSEYNEKIEKVHRIITNRNNIGYGGGWGATRNDVKQVGGETVEGIIGSKRKHDQISVQFSLKPLIVQRRFCHFTRQRFSRLFPIHLFFLRILSI